MKTNQEYQFEAEILANPLEQAWVEYNTCCLCGTELEFHHQANRLTQSVIEQAYCPSCQVRTKATTHRLQ